MEISRRRNKFPQIDKDKLEKLNLKDTVTIAEIADIFLVSYLSINRALAYYKIPHRRPVNKAGYKIDVLRKLRPNEPEILESQCIQKHFIGSLNREAKQFGFRIKIQEIAEGTYKNLLNFRRKVC